MSSASLPPYSAVASPPLQPAAPSSRPVPSINLLLLGSPGIGKSTFISQLAFVRDGRLQKPTPASLSTSTTGPGSGSGSDSTSSRTNALQPQQVANPSTFHVSLFARPYNISLYRSTSALFIDPFPDQIDALILCFAVDDRVSLFNMQKYWGRVFTERYDDVPRMVLGLKRDERHARKQRRGDGAGKEEYEFVCVMPEEGLEVAKDMQCDRYAECSARTGELMFEALEDVTRMAAGTTTDNGGFSQGDGCVIL